MNILVYTFMAKILSVYFVNYSALIVIYLLWVLLCLCLYLCFYLWIYLFGFQPSYLASYLCRVSGLWGAETGWCPYPAATGQEGGYWTGHQSIKARSYICLYLWIHSVISFSSFVLFRLLQMGFFVIFAWSGTFDI